MFSWSLWSVFCLGKPCSVFGKPGTTLWVRGIEVVCGLCLPGEESGPSGFATVVAPGCLWCPCSWFLCSLWVSLEIFKAGSGAFNSFTCNPLLQRCCGMLRLGGGRCSIILWLGVSPALGIFFSPGRLGFGGIRLGSAKAVFTNLKPLKKNRMSWAYFEMDGFPYPSSWWASGSEGSWR